MSQDQSGRVLASRLLAPECSTPGQAGAEAGEEQEVAARPICAPLIGQHALFRASGAEKYRPGAIAKQGKALLVVRVDHAAVTVTTDDQCATTRTGCDELASRDQRIREPGARGG